MARKSKRDAVATEANRQITFQAWELQAGQFGSVEASVGTIQKHLNNFVAAGYLWKRFDPEVRDGRGGIVYSLCYSDDRDFTRVEIPTGEGDHLETEADAVRKVKAEKAAEADAAAKAERGAVQDDEVFTPTVGLYANQERTRFEIAVRIGYLERDRELTMRVAPTDSGQVRRNYDAEEKHLRELLAPRRDAVVAAETKKERETEMKQEKFRRLNIAGIAEMVTKDKFLTVAEISEVIDTNPGWRHIEADELSANLDRGFAEGLFDRQYLSFNGASGQYIYRAKTPSRFVDLSGTGGDIEAKERAFGC